MQSVQNCVTLRRSMPVTLLPQPAGICDAQLAVAFLCQSVLDSSFELTGGSSAFRFLQAL